MSRIAVVLLFLGLNYYTYYHLATEELIPPRTKFAEFPLQIGDWQCLGQEKMEDRVLAQLGASDYLICEYIRREPRTQIGVYVGYHETQVRKEGGGSKENSIHPPEHCLPGSGWDVIDASIVPLELQGLPRLGGLQPEAKRFVIAKGSDRQLVYFWYQSAGRVVAKNHAVILYRFLDRATRHRTDGSLVRFTVPILRGDEALAEENFRHFAEQFVALLSDYVPS